MTAPIETIEGIILGKTIRCPRCKQVIEWDLWHEGCGQEVMGWGCHACGWREWEEDDYVEGSRVMYGQGYEGRW